MAFRRGPKDGPPAHPPAANPLVAEMLAWADEFEAGLINDPALLDGSVTPGERVAVRVGPVSEVVYGPVSRVPTITEVGPTGSLLTTDRRAILQTPDGASREWWWADLEAVTALASGLGVMWAPSEPGDGRGGAGGAVIPAYARGELAPEARANPMLTVFMRVAIAWRASQPEGLAGWRKEFTARYVRS